jgi:hypothetical protein
LRRRRNRRPSVLRAVGLTDWHWHCLYAACCRCIRSSLACWAANNAFPPPRAAAGLYLRAGYGADLHGARPCGPLPGCSSRPLQHPYVLIGLSVVFILLALSMFGLFTCSCPHSANPLNADEQPSAGRIGRRRVCDGCHAGLICSLHHRTTQRHPAVHRPERQYVAWRRYAVSYALGMGLPLILSRCLATVCCRRAARGWRR